MINSNIKLITIDFLILNFNGAIVRKKLKSDLDNPYVLNQNPYKFVKHEYGNKIFTDVYDLYLNDLKLGIVNAVPRSTIINEKLVQIQFENHIFYTQSLQFLSDVVTDLGNYYDLTLSGVNRLDIAVDSVNTDSYYDSLVNSVINGDLLVKGRSKCVNLYYETHKGKSILNGFSIGKRSSSRYLRVYNKSLNLQSTPTPKTYINDYFIANGLPTQNIWRFEYQLNSSFFTYLYKRMTDKAYLHIFSVPDLINLIELAQKNHFELCTNTGKTETNKEKTIIVHCYDTIRKFYNTKVKNLLSRIKKPFELSLNIQKRLLKSLFRNYYLNQSMYYFNALYLVLNEYNLFDYFNDKLGFYLHEFINKEKIKGTFKLHIYNQHLNEISPLYGI